MKHLLVCALAGALALSLAACGTSEAAPTGSAPGASEIPEGAVMTCRLVGEGLLAEGDRGTLTFQGTRYLGFERQ